MHLRGSMRIETTRRKFSGVLLGAAAGATMLRGATSRNLKIGHTCITWGTFPRGADAGATLEPAVKDIAALGYWGFETFPEVLEDWDKRDALRPLMDKHNLPLTSGYIRINVTEPDKAKESLEGVVRLGKVIKKYGGVFGVIQVNGVKRDGYVFPTVSRRGRLGPERFGDRADRPRARSGVSSAHGNGRGNARRSLLRDGEV